MPKRRKPTELERALGWTFRDPALLVEALTHSTYANEHGDAGPCNERLEFLGDAVLGLLAGKLLFDALAVEPEGELTTRRARVVQKEALAELASALDLGTHLRLGEGQRHGGGANQAVLADAYEALAGALFLDGGFTAAERVLGPTMLEAIARADAPSDFKTRLQEICHRLGKTAPSYGVREVSGPAHARRYRCEVTVDDAVCGVGEGGSKKMAEQACAKLAIERLSEASA